MIKKQHTALAGIALVALVGLAGCGDTKPPAESKASSCASPGKTVTVEVGSFVFNPATVKVAACDEVVWKNTHTQPHTSTGTGSQRWSSGNIQPGATSDPVAFDKAGTYTYICALHPFMKGTVEVS